MTSINAATADALAQLKPDHRPRVLVGFDGFIDHIIKVVDTRADEQTFQAMPTIAHLGKKISAAAGKSANFELVVTKSKIGGNGPIMANALCSYDHVVSTIGLLGEGGIDPVFTPLTDRAETVINLGGPGITDALEFEDGKLMLGKLTPLTNISYANILAKTGGRQALIDLIKRSSAVATVNWTMSIGLTEIWEKMAAEILPNLGGKRPLWFVDLADPAKRTVADRKAAFAALGRMQKHVDVVLGMNEMELRQVLETIGKSWQDGGTEYEQARKGCEIVRDALGLGFAMCHLVKSAACAWAAGAGRHGSAAAGSACGDGFFDPKPVITTGAGDHFNAGFVCAILGGLHPEQALQAGGATSGHYVRTAVSPSRADTIAFLRKHA